MDWWDRYKDALTAISATIAALIAIGGIVWAVIKWGFLRGWKRKLRGDVKVFDEVITDPAILLPRLFGSENDDSPLADHRISYQPRDPKRDIQAELKAALYRSHYLLITAPTGYGKTREAGVLSQTMMLEGWRVLRIKTGWLDVPKTLPDELNNNRSRVLLLLDDLNGLFSTGEGTQSPRAEQIPLISEASYHDRLLQVLNYFEETCTKREIRVIATARSEADQWSLLNYDEKDKLWKRFERVELPEPADSAFINLLEDATKQADLPANPEEFEAIVHKNDGTYKNILLNLRRWKSQNKAVSKDDFTGMLNGSWQEIYERAVTQYPAVKYIYDAIDILRQANIDLFPFLVESTALIVWGESFFQKLHRQRKISRSIRHLTEETNILRTANEKLAPGDGQIEAKQYAVSWYVYRQSLVQLMLKRRDLKMQGSIYRFAITCYYRKQFELALSLITRYLQLNPTDPYGHNASGVFLSELRRYAEAEDAYRQAIAKDPNSAAAYSNLGLLLHEKLERYAEAEDAYRQAIAKDPNYAAAYSNLGNLLSDKKLERYAEAEDAYRQAIAKDPNSAAAYNNMVILLRVTDRAKDSIPLLERMTELNPADFNSYLGIASTKKTLGEAVEASLVDKARQFMPEDDFYNRACLESVCDNYDLAFDYLRKAAQKEKFDPNWAWKDPDFQWIKGDPRFAVIVGPKPEK